MASLVGERHQGPSGASVPAGTRVYAVGDSHGCLDRLRVLHQAILEDHAGAGLARKVAVYLGDYIDRGPDSRGLIDCLIEQPLPGFESVHLKGNHDDFMLRFLAGEDVLLVWLMNGGDATLRSYGIESAAAGFGGLDGVAWLRAELTARLPDEHRRFLESLRMSHVEGDYLFVHAGIRPGVPLGAQNPEDLLWIREPFLTSDADCGKVVVHGHTPVPAPELRPNRIGIDTGACFGGRLTALVLEGADRRFLQA
ncbi:MAG: metallophosphoesterase family protein [Kiloniellaceae bacterium]